MGLQPRIIYRRQKTLKDILAPSYPDLNNNRKKTTREYVQSSENIGRKEGVYRCGRTNCKCCLSIVHGRKDLCSNFTKEKFSIKGFLSSENNFVIYVLECHCGLQYVGRTTCKLRERLNNIKHRYMKHSVSRHFAFKHSFVCL